MTIHLIKKIFFKGFEKKSTYLHKTKVKNNNLATNGIKISNKIKIIHLIKLYKNNCTHSNCNNKC